ncbi:MAG TPA: nucleotidyltransferase domain-containing protein, partial [Herpetosiphonaceae bacterium]|nr:nucleotidyltransferase domain-containing protein [Herpetosiphonaceae bacterium]
MTIEVPRPTPYPDVNAVIHEILSGARAVLAEDLVGMYLVGSLAAGDFDPENSDLDFIIATAHELSDETFTALAEMHARIAAGSSKWAREIEGSYIPRHALRRYDPANARHPHIFRGEAESRLFMMQHAGDWIIQLHVLREHGVVVVGPSPRTLVDPVQPDDLRQA